MPKRTDISKILILGSGPIIIGQSAEFDYSGTQACKALKSEGYEVVLANSNPATIMTDPESADRTYIEPLTLEYLEEIIRIEREMAPGAGFAVLPTVGGQTALNLAIELSDGGVLEKYNATLIGASVAAIKKAEDRLFFKDAMQRIGLDVPKSALVNNTKDGIEFAGKIGFPVIIRPSFTLGGSGGGIAYNREEMLEVLRRGLDFSPPRHPHGSHHRAAVDLPLPVGPVGEHQHFLQRLRQEQLHLQRTDQRWRFESDPEAVGYLAEFWRRRWAILQAVTCLSKSSIR